MDFGITFSLLLLLISVIYFLFQPKKINFFYGYRTPKSLKDIKNWKFANWFFSIGMIVISASNFIVLYLFSLIIDLDKFSVYYFVALLTVEFSLLIYLTEKKMTQNENK